MRTNLSATLPTMALFTAGYAQTPDKAKLDQKQQSSWRRQNAGN